jgi:hypothetical protein
VARREGKDFGAAQVHPFQLDIAGRNAAGTLFRNTSLSEKIFQSADPAPTFFCKDVIPWDLELRFCKDINPWELARKAPGIKELATNSVDGGAAPKRIERRGRDDGANMCDDNILVYRKQELFTVFE